MNPMISSQQAHFYLQNGYIEFESLLSPTECETLETQVKQALRARLKKDPSRFPASQLYASGRDLWREIEPLKTLLLSRRMTSVALGLANKPSLRLGCDQWIPGVYEWSGPAKTKDLFSLQGLACILLIRINTPAEGETPHPTFRQEPGLVPIPSSRGNALIVHPNLLLNFPKMALYSPADLYLAAYTFPSAVYIHNQADPANHLLKQMGYNFGDTLINQHHPLITK
ncbi:MAG: hypothetical protein JSS32_02985 [Verrucomicrobia bacterium]|nr:hypothetical protein [Verrucomicrobiota bacterium]